MLVALRYNQSKLVFAEQRAHGMEVNPFETAHHEGMDYKRWRLEHLFLLMPARQNVGQFPGRGGRRPAASASIRRWKA
jgi:arylsulfatase